MRLPELGLAARSLRSWFRGHRGAVTMAALLAIAAPVRFFIGALSVMQQPPVLDVLEVGLWWLLYAAVFWICLLAAGVVGERLAAGAGRMARGALWIAMASGCALAANLCTAPRARILIEQGVVQGVLPMQLYGFALSFTLAVLYFAHLGRSRSHEQAAARLVMAQRAQREARRRSVQVELQAVQARIDPVLLFGMLEAVRLAYADDSARAERLLDELIAFLRASLPHLRGHASSVAREAELARAYAQLLSLAQAGGWGMKVEVSPAAMHARFPPGALVPLLDGALRARGGQCALQATCAQGLCRVVLELPARPSERAITEVRALLCDAEGSTTDLLVTETAAGAVVTLRVPHENA
jgi:hypothetical protein